MSRYKNVPFCMWKCDTNVQTVWSINNYMSTSQKSVINTVLNVQKTETERTLTHVSIRQEKQTYETHLGLQDTAHQCGKQISNTELFWVHSSRFIKISSFIEILLII